MVIVIVHTNEPLSQRLTYHVVHLGESSISRLWSRRRLAVFDLK